MQACFFTPGPPNFGLSLQKTQEPQSSVRRQAGQSMQRTPLLRGVWGCPPGDEVLSLSWASKGVVLSEGTLALWDCRTAMGVVAEEEEE